MGAMRRRVRDPRLACLMAFRTDASHPCGHAIQWADSSSGPKAQACKCGGKSDAGNEDPRVARIRAVDPDFDPRGRSDVYLDTRVALLDADEKKRAPSPKQDSTSTPARHEDATPRRLAPGAPYKGPSVLFTNDELDAALDAETSGRLDRALEDQAREREAQGKGGPPPGAAFKPNVVRAPEVNTDAIEGEGPLDRALRKQAVEREAAYKSGPPVGAAFKK